MILREKDLKELEKVPAGKWHEVMEFARFLTDVAKSERKFTDKNIVKYDGVKTLWKTTKED